MSKRIVVGILAHVDAGKTTLSEAMLYLAGEIKKVGRVDHQDAFLDTYALERERGITIFSKQAKLKFLDTELTLLDTPGHVDFAAEMERTLAVLDYAILVINGGEGVQGHTKTLWNLLEQYKVPIFIFVNKMDLPQADRNQILTELRTSLAEECIDFGIGDGLDEEIAVIDEQVMEQYFASGRIAPQQIRALISARKIFPCYFGAALKLEGVEDFLAGLDGYSQAEDYQSEFGARVFKIARDERDERLTYLKITGGSLKTRQVLAEGEKIHQIRIYSGEKYETVSEVQSGCVCAVTGPLKTYAGQGVGKEEGINKPISEAVLTYQLVLPPDQDSLTVLPLIRRLEEEDPTLEVVWEEETKEIYMRLMGEIQTEVLKAVMEQRFGLMVDFASGSILYKETIAFPVEGIGHFEPLRHYAEVHLILEPGQPGSGLIFASDCMEDMLSRNYQRLILTHLKERVHRGVLTGAPITDMRITIAAGRSHPKHTEGGDFRQATYRALRQGLKEAESILLEPYYEFCLELPERLIGRAISDIERMHGSYAAPELKSHMAVLNGTAPAVYMSSYQREVASYTGGEGKLFCRLKGYQPCHNAEEVIMQKGYDSEKDSDNPTGSIFCSHGAGFAVPWNRVREYMHIEAQLVEIHPESEGEVSATNCGSLELGIGTDEIDEIFKRTFYANQHSGFIPHKGISRKHWKQRKEPASPAVTKIWHKAAPREEYLLVDGYNIIHAWEDLKELAQVNIDGARGKLLDILCNYQAIRGCHLDVVFDAYRVSGGQTRSYDYHNIHVVFTKEAETADQYIERFAHENRNKYQIFVATSDGMEQMIVRGAGGRIISARELKVDIEEKEKIIKQNCQE